ncbi:hypothetical protein [Nocardioides sp. URHA0032]|uniref:hypothetical protein n=1 Tax=Nocardioides sp. URHA0032 TaxID=1380388 RepID=UPI00048EE483|nr:hypothetical protein [Nocardioides sp. URHA0032]
MELAVAATFVWLGMVVGISFLEAPLKFRAPGVTLPIGLGIGRLVFRALNAVEAVLAVLVVVGLLAGSPGRAAVVAFLVAAAALVVQVLAVRPFLSRRSDAVLAGDDGPRSRAHLWYVGLELVKVAALVTAGVLLLGR